jgi:Skp family chaperone for outer membrane proteins
MNIKTLILSSLVLLLAAMPVIAQETSEPENVTNPVVAVADLKKIFDSYQKAKDLDAQITENFKTRDEEINRMKEDAQALLEEKLDTDPADPAFAEYEEQLFLLRKQIEYEMKRLAHDLAAESADATELVYNEIRAIIAKISEEDGIDLVLKVDSPNIGGSDRMAVINRKIDNRPVLYSNPKMDITQQIIDRLNADYAAEKKNGEGKGE